MNELTELDIAKARRVLEAATAPAFSLADAINEARTRVAVGRPAPLDPSSRPREYEAAKRWDALHEARARLAAYDAAPQTASPAKAAAPTQPEHMTDAEIRARIAELRARGAK